MNEDEGIEPTASEVVQSEVPDYDAVRVAVETPVRTQSLPTQSGDMSSAIVGATVDLSYKFKRDPKRAVLTLIARDNPMIVARSQAGLRNGAEWPTAMPMVITHIEEVWVMSSTSTAKVSWVLESWTE